VEQNGWYVIKLATISEKIGSFLGILHTNLNTNNIIFRNQLGLCLPPIVEMGKDREMTRRLLVVDDQDSITKIVSRIGGLLGYQVQAVNDPSQALEAFEEFEPDVLVIDLVMPEIDGIDILHRILAMGTDARIIIMSGFGKSYLRLGRDVGAFHDHPGIFTLAKPFRRAELVALLAHKTT
jgi:CheY-like chemotaxis protein